ncbi:MAG: RNA 2',3'-cyclic phosphodiesterase [Pseudomonadota bacterium]
MSERQRLFFALWPDEPLREVITPLLKLHRECGGRAHPPGNLHLTLNFLGGVGAETRDCLERAAGEIIIPPFELTLDHFGYWPRPRVVWLGCSEIPEPLGELVVALNRVVERCGLQPEQRPYQAHLTLLRKARQAPAGPAPELPWRVNDFVLAQSVSTLSGVEYRVLRRWDLKAGNR